MKRMLLFAFIVITCAQVIEVSAWWYRVRPHRGYYWGRPYWRGHYYHHWWGRPYWHHRIYV